MLIAFGGRKRIARVPSYSFENWRLVRSSDTQVVYRPGAWTLMNRLVVMLLAGFAAFGLYRGYVEMGGGGFGRAPSRQVRTNVPPPEIRALTEQLKEDTRASMSEAEWREFERDLAAKEAQRQARHDEQRARLDRIAHVVSLVCAALMGLLAFGGVLAPLSGLWSRITISRDHQGYLVVARIGALWASRRSWPIAAFQQISVNAHEVRAGRRGLRRHIGWRIVVRLVPVPLTDGQRPPIGAEDLTEWGVDFCPLRQKHRPTASLPEPAAGFVRALQQMTGLPCSMAGIDAVPRDGRAIEGFQRVTAGEPTTTRRIYHSLDEVPEELRARAERMMAKAHEQGVNSVRSETITVRDSDGNVRTYHSVDEMPPDLREHYERARRRK